MPTDETPHSRSNAEAYREWVDSAEGHCAFKHWRWKQFLRAARRQLWNEAVTGRPFDVRAFSEEEVRQLLRVGRIETDEVSSLAEYLRVQLTGSVTGSKDAIGLRRYLALGDHFYQAIGSAPIEAWENEALRLIKIHNGSGAKLLQFLSQFRAHFERIPLRVLVALGDEQGASSSQRVPPPEVPHLNA